MHLSIINIHPGMAPWHARPYSLAFHALRHVINMLICQSPNPSRQSRYIDVAPSRLLLFKKEITPLASSGPPRKRTALIGELLEVPLPPSLGLGAGPLIPAPSGLGRTGGEERTGERGGDWRGRKENSSPTHSASSLPSPFLLLLRRRPWPG
jgi:hypothetical protein